LIYFVCKKLLKYPMCLLSSYDRISIFSPAYEEILKVNFATKILIWNRLYQHLLGLDFSKTLLL